MLNEPWFVVEALLWVVLVSPASSLLFARARVGSGACLLLAVAGALSGVTYRLLRIS